MKILFLTADSYPEQTPSSYLGKNRNDAFYAQGWKSVTYTPVPSRGITEEVRKVYAGEKKNEVRANGQAIIHRFSLYKEGKNSLLRALRYFFLCVKLFNRGVFKKDAKECDVMFVSSTPPIIGATAAFVKKVRRDHIPFVYCLQDIFPDSLAGTGLAKKGGLLWKIGRVIENFTYRNADKIIVISQDFKKNIMAKGVPEEKIEVIYNWVDEEAVVDIPRSENVLFDRYGLDRSKFYVTYNGNIGLTQNMDMLLEVAKALESNEDIQFVLVGNGAYFNEVVKKIAGQARNEGAIQGITYPNVTLLPFQPYEEISHVFSLGDVSLVISKPGVGANSVPSKTWSIMSASRPVLANFDENELKSILEGNANLNLNANANDNFNPNLNANLNDKGGAKPCGIFTKAGDKVAFTDAILKLYGDRELCREMGRNGRKFVMDNLTKEVGTAKYVDVIRSFAPQR